ncbi:MAG: phage tail protein I [Polyangia bacterium]
MISQQRALVRMPEVVGLPLGKARLLVESSGLSVNAVVFMESYDARDTVLTQKPSRGQMIYAGEPVTLGISRESYVKWLPAIYQRADLNGKNFVRDLLWIIQHLFSSIEEQLDAVHHVFDPYEAPESFLPWLASWSAMVIEEDWPITKKRRLIKKAIELYRIRGTVKGLKLFISLFTGHEPTLQENVWPFRGWRVGVTSEIAVDTVVLPPVNLAHTFVVEMPVSYKDLSPEAVIRIHEIIQMEKPANTQYYLRFASEEKKDELRELMVIGTHSGIGIGTGESEPITSEEELQRVLDQQGREPERERARVESQEEADDGFRSAPRTRPALAGAPRADTAPVEGKEVRSDAAGGFGASARQMEAVTDTQALNAVDELSAAKTMMTEAPQKTKTTTVAAAPKTTVSEPPKTTVTEAHKTTVTEAPKTTATEAPKNKDDDKKTQLGIPTAQPEPKPETKAEKKPPEGASDKKPPKK